MHPLILRVLALLTLSFSSAQQQTTWPTCKPNGPCLSSGLGLPDIEYAASCGDQGFVRCGALSYADNAQQCSCPSPQICYDVSEGTLLSGNSSYFSPSHPELRKLKRPSGVCLGKPCGDGTMTASNDQVCPYYPRQDCVHRVLRSEGGGPVGSKMGYCLDGGSHRRCVDGGEDGYRCPTGWSCVKDVRNSTGLGYCSPDTLNW